MLDYQGFVNTRDKLSEKWPWDGEFLRLFLLIPGIIGITATLATLPFTGLHALWFLTAIPVGIVLYISYGIAGQRVTALCQELEQEGGEIAEALIVIGKLHSPGVVVLKENVIQLVPVVGKRQSISLPDTKLIGEGRWLPGKFVWGKRAFTFRAEILNPLAFAVPESVGTRWSTIFREVCKDR